MERSERHKHREDNETFGQEVVEHTPMVNTGSSRKEVKNFIWKGKC